MLFSAPRSPPRRQLFLTAFAPIGAGTYDRGDSVLAPTCLPLFANVALTAANIDPGTPAAPVLPNSAIVPTPGPAADKARNQNAQIQGRNQQRPYASHWQLDSATPNLYDAFSFSKDCGSERPARFLVLAGNYKTVTIRHSTLDPGGLNWQEIHCSVVHPDHRKYRNAGDRSSITAAISLEWRAPSSQLQVTDSILQSSSTHPAIDPARA
jgi:hypothetical protein